MSHPKLNDLKPKLSFIIFCSQICNFSKTQRGQHITALQGDSTSGMKTERNSVPGGWNKSCEDPLIYISGSCFWMEIAISSETVVHNTLHMSCPCGGFGFLIAEQLASQNKHPKRMWKLQVIYCYLHFPFITVSVTGSVDITASMRLALISLVAAKSQIYQIANHNAGVL